MGRRKDGMPSAALQGDVERVLQQWERRPEAISLPGELVKRTGTQRQGDGTRVRAQVPFHVAYTTLEEVEATVIAWTPRAVQLEIELPDGRTVRPWVWANAVKRI